MSVEIYSGHYAIQMRVVIYVAEELSKATEERGKQITKRKGIAEGRNMAALQTEGTKGGYVN